MAENKIIRDDVDKFFEYGIDIGAKTLYMGSESYKDDDETGTDFLMAERVIKGLHLLDRRVSDGITILMNNLGGDEYHGMAIYDAITACQNHVTIKVFGHAMSMGSIILQAADQRIMAPNARLMMHYGTWGTHDHPKNVEKWVEEGKRFNKWMIDLYLEKIREKNPRFKRTKVDQMCNFDTILSARETVSLGLADSILNESNNI